MAQERPFWFERKAQGFGWVPVTWQGWTVTFAWAVFTLLAYIFVPRLTESRALGHATSSVIALVSLLVFMTLVRDRVSREINTSVQPLKLSDKP